MTNFGITRANPKLLIKSPTDPGKSRSGGIAADLMHGQYTKQQLLNIRFLFNTGFIDAAIFGEGSLWAQFELMATKIFAGGSNIRDMIAHFRGNTGTDFRSSALTNAARDHALSQQFQGEVIQSLIAAIKKHNGDASKVVGGVTRTGGDVTRKTGLLFSSYRDTFWTGLTIAVNDVWAWRVDLVSYQLNGKNFQGRIRITLFDHFGLDLPDVEKKYGYLAGFRAWFILQHYQLYGYKPFISVMEWEAPFTGCL